jgi:hypothetical protein
VTFTRGDGLGLELTSTVVRGVRLASGDPRRVAEVTEVAIADFDDQVAVFDALVRVRGELGGERVPTRIAWFPAGSTMQRLDVTGMSGPELNAIRHDLDEQLGITSTMLIDADARRWMIVLRWDHDLAWRLEELAERAGFIDATLEPGPVALERVLADDVTVVRRDASGGHSWAAVFDRANPIAATSVETWSREYPSLTTSPEIVGLHRLDDMLTDADLADELARVAGASLASAERTGELGALLHLLDDPYPPFPAHDLRAPQRIAVALGAAVGAAGLAGRIRPVDVTATRVHTGNHERPWAIERVSDVSDDMEATKVPWWHPLWRFVRR